MINIDSKFDKAFKVLRHLEYNNREDKFLHINETESSYTLGGVYQKIHKDNNIIDWEFVDNVFKSCKNDYKRASVLLYHDERINDQVNTFFKKEYWDKNRLSEVQDNKICKKIFLNSVVFGSRTTVKIAQRVIGAADDGFLGIDTIRLLNSVDYMFFNIRFINECKLYIDKIIENNADKEIFRDGWLNRVTYEYYGNE